MQELMVRAWLAGGRPIAWSSRRARAWRSESGEGVISTAIAVLIMALIGLAMWRVFDTVFTDAGNDIQQNVNDIGG